MVLREFEANDVAPANALTNGYIRDTAVHLGLAVATDDQFAEAWRLGRSRFPWVVAELDGAFAGYAKAGPWREREAFSRTCETGIYLTSAQQRRGVGRALYAELLTRLRATGFHAAVAAITLPNEASVRLHARLGFTRAGEFAEVGWKLGRWHDVGFWQLTFR